MRSSGRQQALVSVSVARRLGLPAVGAAPSVATSQRQGRAGQTCEPRVEPAVTPHSSRAGATQAGGPRPHARKCRAAAAGSSTRHSGRPQPVKHAGLWPGRTGRSPHAGISGRGGGGASAGGQRAAQARVRPSGTSRAAASGYGGDCKAAAGRQQQGQTHGCGSGTPSARGWGSGCGCGSARGGWGSGSSPPCGGWIGALAVP